MPGAKVEGALRRSPFVRGQLEIARAILGVHLGSGLAREADVLRLVCGDRGIKGVPLALYAGRLRPAGPR